MPQPLTKFSIDDLAFERNNRFLFSNINCSLQAGELLQIRGANGSGKSTLLRILAGYIEPQTGKILWQGQSITEQRDTYQQQLHYVGHQNGVKPNLTVYENLQLNCALIGIPAAPAHLYKIIERIGLINATQTSQLSAGQTRRLALARLLLQPAPLWILDEPTTALDSQAQEFLLTILNEHLKNNGIAIVATHQDLSLTAKIITLRGQNE